MDWGWQIWVYLWTAGMAGGAFFTGFLVNVFTNWKHQTFFRVSAVTAVPFGIIGVLALLFKINVYRVWHLFVSFEPTAMISIATWVLTLWLTVIFIMFLAWLLEWDAKNNPDKYSYNLEGAMAKTSKVLAWIAFFVSIIMFGYTGVLLANTSVPLWSDTGLLPALFSVSAVSTGIALTIVASLLVNKSGKLSISNDLIRKLADADAVVIVMEALVLTAYVIWLAIIGGAAGTSLSALLTGELAVMFWLGFVSLALLIPIILDLIRHFSKSEGRAATTLIALSVVLTIIGGFFLRIVITIGGQL